RAARLANWFDMLGMDSEYDYDPFWAKCQELGFSPTFHTGSQGLGLRCSVSSWVYNHIGHFAEANDALCKALFLGGVMPPEQPNEFTACGAQSPEDIVKLFVPSFYFGCEAEDHANAWAFNTKVTP